MDHVQTDEVDSQKPPSIMHRAEAKDPPWQRIAARALLRAFVRFLSAPDPLLQKRWQRRQVAPPRTVAAPKARLGG